MIKSTKNAFNYENSNPMLITNQEQLMSTVVNSLLPSSDKLYFLTGFFYFSGFKEIYENLKDKEIRILVGMDIETDLNNKIYEVEKRTKSDSNFKIKQRYFEDLTRIFNETDYLDSNEQQESFRVFVEKIKDGSLEIRKTHIPSHGKFYIFHNKSGFDQDGLFIGSVVHGSSNLTGPGFSTQIESNTLFRDNESYEQFKKQFDELWNQSVDIVKKDTFDDFNKNVVDKIWLDKLPTPYEIYLRVLDEYFSIDTSNKVELPSEITKEKFYDLKYQIDAVQQALAILKAHNGVIIADVVGLGKSIIGSTIAHNLGLRTIVIAPPHLVTQWEEYREYFKFDAQVFSNGIIGDVASRDWGDEERLIIIDEAHKYRNELTRDYANLHKLCQGNKIILLTATPFNNNPKDIFSMIKLFQIPAKSTIQTIDSLSIRFKTLVTEYNSIKRTQKSKDKELFEIKDRINDLANQIRDLLSPLLIRRSRLDLDAIGPYKEDLQRQNITFPEVKSPEVLEYDLGEIGPLYEKTLLALSPEEGEGLIGARYNPIKYLPEEEIEKIAEQMETDINLVKNTQVNLAKFMKRLLVHRFESSIYAFKSTLNNIISSYETALDWYNKGVIPIYKKGELPDIESVFEDIGDEVISEIDEILLEKLSPLTEKGLILIDAKTIDKAYHEDLLADLNLLKSIKEEWVAVDSNNDPKVKNLESYLCEMITKEPNRKIVIFTEYSDTADFISTALKNDNYRVFKYSAADASKENKNTIRKNFDAGYKDQSNDFDILVATDAISEGYNLHRAGTIFNYDIPYNPTRVIQRVGRINRINKKVFDTLLIFNFFPTVTGEQETNVKRITTLKIALIHALLGEDTKYLTNDEELKSFYKKQFEDSMSEIETLSWDAKYKNILESAKINNKEIWEKSKALPKRARIQRASKNPEKSGVIVFGRKGNDYAFRFCDPKKTSILINTAEAVSLFEADISEEPKKTSDKFEPLYQVAKSKLFNRKTEVAKDRGVSEALDKITEMKRRLPDHHDYLSDLYMVINELDALPERYTKQIRNISFEKLQDDFAEFIKEVPHSYINSIIEKANSIDEGAESLILAEEFSL